MTDVFSYRPLVQPTLAAADRAAEAALALARERGLAIAVTVVDASGYPLSVRRMEKARPIAAAMAQAKAWTAMVIRRDTGMLQAMAAPGEPAFGFQHQFPGVGSILPGGIPVTTSAGVHAAVGVSGADRDGDIACAEAAGNELSRLIGGQDRGQD